MKEITVEELEKIESDQSIIVDIRPNEQFLRGTFPGAVNIPMDEWAEKKKELDVTKNIYLICHTGDKSQDCVQELLDEGYCAVNVKGGYRAYLRLSLSRFMQEDSQNAKEKKKEEIERSIIKKYRRTIWRPFTKALNEYQLIQEGDRVAVCISGRKDSMLSLRQNAKRIFVFQGKRTGM